MVAIRYSVAVLILCGVATARHHKHEASEVSPDPAKLTDPDTPAPDTDKRQRKKRWYSSYGYQQPLYRDDLHPGAPPAQAPYDPFAYIYRRLDELTALIRQPPPPPQGPILVPYPVYLTPACGCPSGGTPDAGTPQEPMPNITIPNRLGDEVDDYDDVPLRPLSFDPVKPDRPLSRPAPSVEHSPAQGGAPSQQASGFASAAAAAAAAPPVAPGTNQQPSRCDIATLTCCHQLYTTNLCFNALGCPGALRTPNPCDPRTLSRVVQIFQNFYRNN